MINLACTCPKRPASVTCVQGTWHAGPLFADHPYMDFYNLELSDTNETDFNSHSYKADGVEFQVVDP